MKKILCFLMLLLLVTGCSYKYSVKIDKKKKVAEEIDVYENNSVFTSKGTSPDSFIDMNINIYKKDPSIFQYDIKKNISDISSGVIVKAYYKNFDDFTKKTKVKKNLFGKMELYEMSGYGYFTASDYRGELFFTDEESDFRNESVEFVLELPFEVVENNADSVDVLNGIYKWYFNSGIVDKKINIKFDLNNYAVKENIFIRYIYFALIPVFIFIIAMFVLIKNKRVNKI